MATEADSPWDTPNKDTANTRGTATDMDTQAATDRTRTQEAGTNNGNNNKHSANKVTSTWDKHRRHEDNNTTIR